MLVSDLISELKKFPQDSLVAWQDHGEETITAHVGYVTWFDPESCSDDRFCAGVYVVLRPYFHKEANWGDW